MMGGVSAVGYKDTQVLVSTVQGPLRVSMMMSGSRMVPWLGILLLLVLEVKSFVPTTRFAVSRPSIGLSRQHQWSKPSPPTYVLSSVSDADETEELADSIESSNSTERLGPLARLRKYYAKSDDGLTFRQRLGKMGLNVALSYGWVSNMSYAVTVSLAWYIFSKRVSMVSWGLAILFLTFVSRQG